MVLWGKKCGIKNKCTELPGKIGTGTQYGMVGAQQGAIDAQFETYKEMTNQIDMNRQATETAIQQRNQVIQSQQMALQAFQTNMNQQ